MGEPQFSDLVAQHKENKQVRVQRTKDGCKERLHNIAAKKIQTTMIGALSAVEEKFGFLWGFDVNTKHIDLTPEQLHMKELFDEVRSEILDNGNNQIRNFGTEIDEYEISWNRYSITLPVRPEGPKGSN